MKLTREEALKLHHQMWTDMQTDLGDNPSLVDRAEYKEKWCEDHFPNERIESNCFLCEYASQYADDGIDYCDFCPIMWDNDYNMDWCIGEGVTYERSPISEILALPEREVEDETSDS